MQQAIIGANDDPDLCRHYDITRPQWVNAADQFHNTWVKYMYLVHDVLTIFCIRYAHAYVALYFTKQITICAEYWDMVPKVKAGLSGTAGLRPIGRSPGVPDKPAEALVTMSRYSAQIFCFIAYIFHFSIPLWVGFGNLAYRGLPWCPLSLSTVITMRLLVRQSTLPACFAWTKELKDENTLWHICHRTGETDRWNGCNPYKWEIV